MKRSLALLPITLLLLTGCTTAPDEPDLAATYVAPNCGFELLDQPAPERVVTIKSSATETLIALGLEDRIVGTAFLDAPLPEGVDLPVLSDFMPSQEALLELQPDFVYSGWESAFTPEAAGDRAELATLGIGSYVASTACTQPDLPIVVNESTLSDQIMEVATIFGAESAGSDLVGEQMQSLENDKRADERGFTALWWSSGDDTPYVGAGSGAPQFIMDELGLTNIASGIAGGWTPLGWEAIIEANPDVIVLVDASWNTAESKKAELLADPATAGLSAVVNERYLEIPFPASEAGVRTIPAIIDLANDLKKL